MLEYFKVTRPRFLNMCLQAILRPKTHSEEECVCVIHICMHNGRLHIPILKMQICEEVSMCLIDHLNQTHLSFLFFFFSFREGEGWLNYSLRINHFALLTLLNNKAA